MKNFLIFCLLLLSISSFGQSAILKGLKTGDGVYFAKGHFARAKWTMDTSSLRLLFDDQYSLQGTNNAQFTGAWRLDVTGYSGTFVNGNHAFSGLTGTFSSSSNTVGSFLSFPLGSAYLQTHDQLTVSPFTLKEGTFVVAPDSIAAGITDPTTGVIPLYIKLNTSKFTVSTRLIDTANVPPANVMLAQYNGSNSTGQTVNSSFVTGQTSANLTGTVQGIQNVVKLSHSSLAALATEGISSTIFHTGAGTSVSVRAFQANIANNSAAGNVTQSIGFYYPGAVVGSTGSFTSDYGLYLDAANAGSGTITNRWGVFQIDALAKNRFDGKLLVNNILTATGNPAVIVHDADSTFKQMTLSLPSSGSYTPALVNTTNISASALNYATYQQIGNIVTVHVSGTLTSSDGTNVVILTIDLPVSTSTTFQDAAGSGSVTLWIGSHGSLVGIIPLYALVSNGTHFQIKCFPTTTTISDFAVTIQYHTN